MHGHRHTRRESGWDGGWGGGWGGQGNGPGFGPGRGPWGGPGGPGGRGRPGPPPWVADLVRHFGGPGVGPEFGGRRGPRARRGDVRAAILDVLAGDEMNGYQLIQQISERTRRRVEAEPGLGLPDRPAARGRGPRRGPTTCDGRRLLRLTDAGRAYVEENADEMAATWRPFEEQPTRRRPGRRRCGRPHARVGQVMGAMWQIVTTGTSQQRAEAAEILTETRRKLYGLLADGDPE